MRSHDTWDEQESSHPNGVVNTDFIDMGSPKDPNRDSLANTVMRIFISVHGVLHSKRSDQKRGFYYEGRVNNGWNTVCDRR